MRNAAASGMCAAAGAVFGKVAFGKETAEALIQSVAFAGPSSPPEALVWAVRVVFALAMLATNACMMHLYVRALSSAGTLLATVTNTGVNVIASSVLAFFLFDEHLSAQWFLGALFLLSGIFCIQKAGLQHHGDDNGDDNGDKKQQ